MKTALVINSFASASQIGGTVAQFVLQCFGIRVIFLPSVLVGRHPGHGDPGMVDISADAMRLMFAAIEDQGLLPQVDAVLTGYFRSAEQVQMVRTMIAAVKSANPSAFIAVDPVMGDHPAGLYVPEAVVQAIKSDLLPLAQMITPNHYEMEVLAGCALPDPDAILVAAKQLGPAEIHITSGPEPDVWSHFLVTGETVHSQTSPRLPGVPKGTGDLLASLILAHRLGGDDPRAALLHGIEKTRAILEITTRAGMDELALALAKEVLKTRA